MLGEFVVCYEFAQQIYVVKLIPRNGTQAVPYESISWISIHLVGLFSMYVHVSS